MPKIVSPDDFASVFDQAARLQPHAQALAENWKNGKRWGEALCLKETGVLAEVAHTLGLDYRREYAKIDAVFYERVPVEEGVKRLYSLAVAIEDEGLAKSSTWELNQLASINVPLKVLFTYPKQDWREDRLLSVYERILVQLDTFHDFATHRKQLVIFGARVSGAVTWRYFKFAERGFERIEPTASRPANE